MAEKLIWAIGPTGSRRHTWAIVAAIALVGSVMVAFVPGAQAVHDLGNFELDRNAVDEAALGDDWDLVFAGTDSAGASVFEAEGTGVSIFTTGGSKDDLDTTSWQHKDGNVPNKDELLNAYAARYGEILYFGADRFANNGDAVMGFWFFQEEVVAQPDGTFGPGTHQNGDILVLSDFTIGGGTVTIRVFQWNSPGGAINGTLDLIAGSEITPADCVGPPSVPNGDPFCATVNDTDVASPWPFTPKQGVSGTFPPGQFYEGGIDLSFLDLGNACFASFLAESRASTSVDSTLKDFVGGAFQPCETEVTTTPQDDQGQATSQIVLGDSVQDHALIVGSGSNTAPTGTVTFYICDPSELTNGACETGGTFVSTNGVTTVSSSSSEATSNLFTPDEAGTWCWRGEYSGDDLYPAAEDASTGECFDVIQLQPAIATTQTFTIQDTATITVGSGAGDLAGTIRFRLYDNASCDPGTSDENLLYDSNVNNPSGIAVSGTSPQEVDSETTTITTSEPTLSWLVEYTSTNSGHKNVTSACNTENASLSITNG